MVENSISNYKDFLNKVSKATDIVTISPIWGFYDVLNRVCPPPREGDPIPIGSHWCFFQPHVPMSEVGEDGHPKRGKFMPDPPNLPRRMFAGSSITFFKDIKIGDKVLREQKIQSISEKKGKSGELLFVNLEEKYIVDGKTSILQINNIVYREAPNKTELTNKNILGKQLENNILSTCLKKEIIPDPVMLFKYSAITFNGHRIHYDRKYAIDKEGYPGLVVHGPLTATFLMHFCENTLQKHIKKFEFRAIKPIFDIEKFMLNLYEGKDNGTIEVYATNLKNEICMSAKAVMV